MIESKLKKPGKLVKFRGRRCVVQPSSDHEMILLKPLGGSDDEMISVFEPILQAYDKIEDDQFELPDKSDLDSFLTAKLLYDAARLSFRQVSGPFRCMGKLSFRPRSYQLVPLIMALKQAVTRLLIADDVGVGKTIEAILILRELLERGTIKSFAVLCPPHLCEQWQKELADKLDIDAVIVRSSTVAGLERKIVGDDTLNVFNYYPYQVVSVDYVKNGSTKMPAFLKDVPDLVIVDEAHTCTKNLDFKKVSQNQQRYELLEKIAKNEHQHLVLLTATPHSGKDGEFKSLLGLVNPDFEGYDFSNLTIAEKRKVAAQFIQRKRKNIEKWLEEETPFPKRTTEELPYTLSSSSDYFKLYQDVLKFARGINTEGITENKARIKYFAALSLLRGVMSSPAAGYEMLQKRKSKILEPIEITDDEVKDNPIVERWDEQSDSEQIEIIDRADLSDNEWNTLHKLAQKAIELTTIEKDNKVRLGAEQIKLWINKGQSPIVFCRFIATAQYVAKILRSYLPKDVDIRAITSELSDEERREKIEEMAKSPKRVLVATDCLSEGINLQDKFNAILHYDLPWNPNRLEQREGRVDRYGQPGWVDKNGTLQNTIDVKVLFGEDNPIDVVVLKIIIEKIQRIQNTSGVSIALADNNRSVMDKVLKEVLLNPEKAQNQFSKQMKLDFGTSAELDELDVEITNEIETAREKAEKIRSIFAHESIMPEEVKKDLHEVDEAIGDVATLEAFVLAASKLLGANVEAVPGGYVFKKTNMDDWMASALGQGDKIHFSFQSPTPQGFRYLGRNHRFVEQLCHRIIANSLDKERKGNKAARAAVFRTDAVSTQTTLIQFRVRNVIREISKQHEMVSEEMFLWGYEQTPEGIFTLTMDKCKELLHTSNALDISKERQEIIFEKELQHFQSLHPDFIKVVADRSEELVNAHTRFAKYIGAKRFEAVIPVLPPDILGVYVLIPNPKI
ncbi:helicase-related protein [Haliscomenobacter hydrossis]|uniref:Helicase domain-containing protein n=1 Tax=Haliscomenobacter hydrossis (strain ATCC 27775 / DSM 1100 / LMG 10767 / O) TaxID=760192 RepID=F4L304_HALH1|nr:helicase-related protein [Haliscomenobacter hydrossis]AEE50663.1 helicase domain-containing protein [Haliscomenobacter hydrossis DSM 1100]